MRAPRTAGPWAAALALFALACADRPPPRSFAGDFTVTRRLAVDPATSLGEFFLSNETNPVTRDINESLGALSCNGEPYSLAFRVESTLDDDGGEGTLALLFVQSAAESICDGGDALLDPYSLTDRRDRTSYLVSGPLFFEGRRLDGRIPMGNIEIAGFSSAFPAWWSFSARLEGFDVEADLDEGQAPTPMLEDVAFSAPWTVQQLSSVPARMSPVVGLTFFDIMVGLDLQPDLDRDGDGLETFEGRPEQPVSACIDGDGTRYEEPACAQLPQFADAYELRLRFRVRPITVHD